MTLLRLAWIAVPVLVIALIIQIFIFELWPPSWQYTVGAETEVAMINLPEAQETSWRVDGGVLCVRERLDSEMLSPLVPSPCGNWLAYRVADKDPAGPANELVLTIGGSGQGTIHALLEAQTDGGLMLALRNDSKGKKNLGVLHANNDSVALPSRANLIWQSGERSARVLVFPFKGELTAGRDVNWSYNRMLHTGQLAVYSTSDKSAARRELVQQMDLMLGDQVRLYKTAKGSEVVWPRGHLRFAMAGSNDNNPSMLELAGIGLADSLIVERFGGSKIEFRPGFWSRLTHDNLALLLAVLIGLLTILSSYTAMAGYFLGGEPRCQTFCGIWKCLCNTWHPRPSAQTTDKHSEKA